MEISPNLATACMNNYVSIMKAGILKPILFSFTESVSFSTPAFAAWLESNNYLERSTELKVSLGIYTPEVAKEIGKPEYEGRLTTFVWPVVDGEPQPPFNMGEMQP